MTNEKKIIISNNSKDINNNILFLPKNKSREAEGGLRTNGYFKQSLPDKPLITIITVVYNGDKYLEETILSVINQTYDNIEYLIIDGGSTDGTMNIIKKYEDKIDYWISEPDNGIYDAMNKGVDCANGVWINFMNTGDVFSNSTDLEKIKKYFLPNTDVIYGSVLKKIQGFDIVEIPGSLSSLWKGMIFSHQSCFIKRSILSKYPFDISLKVAADFKQIFHIYSDNYTFKEINFIISKIIADGVSDKRRLRSTLERFNIVMRKSGGFKVLVYYFYLFIKEIIVLIVKKILPFQVNSLFYKLKYSKK